MTEPAFDLILFDLGGVLVDISGSREMQTWLKPAVSETQFWQRWLYSPSARAFESGRCDSETFAIGMIEEFGLSVTPARFIQSFAQWIKGPYPGVAELMNGLSDRLPLGCLSNNNPCHWPRIRDEMQLGGYFDYQFVSYQIGLLKPDAEIFEHAIEVVGCRPSRILFLDDNAINVQSARHCGLVALHVYGPLEAAHQLKKLGLAD